jgi:hypothetical protein
MLTIDRLNTFFSTYASLRSKSFKKHQSNHLHTQRLQCVIDFVFVEWVSFVVEDDETFLNDDAEHVLLENFNLHHSLWSDSIRFTQHIAVDQLIELFNTTHMQFCLSQNIIIWKARNLINTIDLMFMTSRLQTRVTHCENRFDLNQFSNHIFVFTIFTLKMKQTFNTKKRVWKRFDYDKFWIHLLLLVASSASRCVNEIKNLTQQLQKSITIIIFSTIFLIKTSFKAQLYWNQKCANVVQTIRRKRREWTETRSENRWRNYLHASNVKKKIIAKKKSWNSKKSLKFSQISRRFFDDSFVERASKVISSRKFQKCWIWCNETQMTT